MEEATLDSTQSRMGSSNYRKDLAALWIYSYRSLFNIHQITWIPIIDYLGVLLLAGLIGFGLWVAGRFSGLPKVSKQHS